MRNLFSLLVTVGLAVSAVSAQQVTDFRKPGDAIRLEIKFDGTDAARIRQVNVMFSRQGPGEPADQVGFSPSFGNGWTGESAPLVFRVEVTVPTNIATGDYILYVNAMAENGRTSYVSGNQFKFPVIHIRNDRTFAPPTITVTERRP